LQFLLPYKQHKFPRSNHLLIDFVELLKAVVRLAGSDRRNKRACVMPVWVFSVSAGVSQAQWLVETIT
jgi:hypothetical protein